MSSSRRVLKVTAATGNPEENVSLSRLNLDKLPRHWIGLSIDINPSRDVARAVLKQGGHEE